MVIWAKCNPIWAKCDPIWQIHMKSGHKCSRIAGRKFNHSVAKHEPRVARRGSRGQSSCRTLCNRTNNSYLLGLLRNVGLIFGIVNERNVGHGHCGLAAVESGYSRCRRCWPLEKESGEESMGLLNKEAVIGMRRSADSPAASGERKGP